MPRRPVPRRSDPPASPFWREKPLAAMSPAEWESLCDGCGRCCVIKLEDEDSGEVLYTDVGCRLLDLHTCRCRDYPNRQTKVSDCVRLTPEKVETIAWLPETCAYRLIGEGRDLPAWHPLRTGDPGSVHRAGISVRDRLAGTEDEFTLEELVERALA